MLAAAFVLSLVLLFAALAGRLAESRGRSFWVYFVFCALVPFASVVAIIYLSVFVRRTTPPGTA